MGRLSEAEHAVARLKSRAQENDEAVGLAHTATVRLAISRGDALRAEQENARALEAAEASGNLSGLVIARSSAGEICLLQGRYAEALVSLEAALALHRTHRVFRQIEPFALCYMATAHLHLGAVDAAHEAVREALDISVERGTLAGELAARLRLAEISIVRDGARGRADVDLHLDRAEALLDETHSGAQRPLLHLRRAECAAVAGDPAERERQLREAMRLYEAMGAPLNARRVAQMMEVAE